MVSPVNRASFQFWADSVANFPDLEQGERKLLVESLVEQVEIGQNKRVAASLRPPFAFGYLSPVLAPKEEKPKVVAELIICLTYDLAAYYGAGSLSATRVGTEFSGKEYTLQPTEPNTQTAGVCAMRLGLPASDMQTAGAARITAQAP